MRILEFVHTTHKQPHVQCAEIKLGVRSKQSDIASVGKFLQKDIKMTTLRSRFKLVACVALTYYGINVAQAESVMEARCDFHAHFAVMFYNNHKNYPERTVEQEIWGLKGKGLHVSEDIAEMAHAVWGMNFKDADEAREFARNLCRANNHLLPG